jgi:uncharacterized protein YcaQ
VRKVPAAVIRLSAAEARGFHRRALLLDTPVRDIASALAHLGFVQIDPINVCGRMHDLILRNRVVNYREGELMRYLHGELNRPISSLERTAFEHHLPQSNVLAAMPLDAWPHLLAAMRGRSSTNGSWSGKMDARQRQLSKTILAEIASKGPLCSDDIDDGQRDHQGWGPHASLAKTTLHKLFFHGRVMIARRVGNRRYYDLPERILPPAVVGAAEPTARETRRWLILLKLRQRRLVAMSGREVRCVADLVQRIEVKGCPLLYCLCEDLPLLDARDSSRDPILLAPLDPLIYDRRVTHGLWGYSYTWEVYTPPAKRVRGYYALPVLAETEIVGHIDPKADRAKQKLIVMNRSIRRGHRSASAVRGLASFLGLS